MHGILQRPLAYVSKLLEKLNSQLKIPSYEKSQIASQFFAMKRSAPSNSPESVKKLKTSASVGQADGEGWTKVQKRKQKKEKKTEAKLDSTQPRFMYSNTEIVKRKNAVVIDDIRDLVLHIVADAPPPNWLKVENAPAIQQVVALLIPGLTRELLSLPAHPTSATTNPNLPVSIPLPTESTKPSQLPFITSTFSHACPTRAPGDSFRMHSVLSSFFSGPVSGHEQKKRMEQRIASERALDKDPARHILSINDMIENDYPIPSYMADVFQKPAGWIETPEQEKPSLLAEPDQNQPKQNIYSIDCEMCLTEDGKELTRVSIIDYYTEKVVYDQLVKPAKPILDYLTRWSGITEAALAPITTTLADVQSHLTKLLNPGPPRANPFSTTVSSSPPLITPTPILLGHSLESDLKALKLCHPFCIDTALMYHHPRGRPLKPGLAWLTKKWCGREIQMGGEGGHNPEEDARACLDLLKKKLENGPGFGEFKTDFESIFERMGRSAKRSGASGKIKTAVVDHGKPGVMHGAKADTAIGCNSDEEVLRGVLDVLPLHQFTFARFTALANILGWTTPKTVYDPSATLAPDIPTIEPVSPSVIEPVLETLNAQLTELHAALPPRAVLLIFTGHSDPRRMATLNARKTIFENAVRNGKTLENIPVENYWTAENGRELEEQVERAKRGLLFLSVKQ